MAAEHWHGGKYLLNKTELSAAGCEVLVAGGVDEARLNRWNRFEEIRAEARADIVESKALVERIRTEFAIAGVAVDATVLGSSQGEAVVAHFSLGSLPRSSRRATPTHGLSLSAGDAGVEEDLKDESLIPTCRE